MRSPLGRVAEHVIRDVVADGWGLSIGELRYLPEGGGAYHWIAYADDVRRWFVTCDDLDTKPWLGSDRDSVFEGLLAAYGTAIDLRRAGLDFVGAPFVASSGAPAVRVDERHSVSVFEYVEGEPGRWGQPVGRRERHELITMLALLHRSTPAVHTAARRGLDVPDRAEFEAALGHLDRRWDGGPLSELARHELATNMDLVVRSLSDLDRFRVGLDGTDAVGVVTHGEPHPGNLIRSANGLVLVDWDTVAVARPERDLWMLDEAGASVVSVYCELTGTTLDRDALMAYRLLWALADLAAFTIQLRGEHAADADAENALVALRSILSGREPSPYGRRP
jgi:spectinomycin phosphotransferase